MDNNPHFVPATAPSYESIVDQPAQNPYYQCIEDLSEQILLENGNDNKDELLGCYKHKKASAIILGLVILMVAVGLTTFYVTIAYGSLRQYGQKCNPSVPMSCASTELICQQSGLCGCKSSDYRWDQQQGLCMALVNSDSECRKWGWDGKHAIPCTSNAVCNANHRCECVQFFVAVEHECIGSYDAICNSSKDCNQQEFLFCGTNGKCGCRPGTVRRQRGNSFGCFVKIGESCSGIMRDLCVDPNSNCTTEEICRCNKHEGFIPRQDNTSCGKTVNYTCSSDSDCADTLSCVKSVTTDQLGVCYCRDTEILNETDQECLIKAGNSCDVRDLKQCVANASCRRSTCVCNRGYGLDEASGSCLGTHGTACETNTDCLGSHFFQCSGGKCSCDKNHNHLSDTTGSCFGNTTGIVCFDDLNCDQPRMKCDQTTKMCTCGSGFKEDNQFCYGTHGSFCTDTSDCSLQQMLTCLEGSCGCNSVSEEWEESECKLQFNERCGDPGKRMNMKCVGNLTCLTDPTHTNDVFNLCGCKPNYIVSEDKRLCVSNAISIEGSILAAIFALLSVKLLY